MKKTLAVTFFTIIIVFVATIFLNFKFVSAETTSELTEAQLKTIKTNCPIVKDNLRSIQHEDSRVREHLGRYYTTILSNFITPLNLVLVSNNISSVELIENQTNFVTALAKFTKDDYKTYQDGLRELVALDCATEPAKFYNKLIAVREMRAKVANDTAILRELANKQIDIVSKLKENL